MKLNPAQGQLALKFVTPRAPSGMWETPNLLLQKFPAPSFQATVEINASGNERGDECGLIVFGYDHCRLGILNTGDSRELRLIECHEAHEGGEEREVATARLTDSSVVRLRVDVEDGGVCRFSWNAGGESFHAIGDAFQARESRWVGAKVGLYAKAKVGTSEGRYATFSNFRVK
mgnify:CR=1 FL=1